MAKLASNGMVTFKGRTIGKAIPLTLLRLDTLLADFRAAMEARNGAGMAAQMIRIDVFTAALSNGLEMGSAPAKDRLATALVANDRARALIREVVGLESTVDQAAIQTASLGKLPAHAVVQTFGLMACKCRTRAANDDRRIVAEYAEDFTYWAVVYALTPNMPERATMAWRCRDAVWRAHCALKDQGVTQAVQALDALIDELVDLYGFKLEAPDATG